MAAARPRLAFVTTWLPDPEGTGSEQRSYSFLKAYARHFDVELWFSAKAYSWEFSRIGKAAAHCMAARFFHVELLRHNVDKLQDTFNASLAAADHAHLFKLPFGISHKSVLWDYDELPPNLRQADGARITEYDRVFQRFSQTCRLRFCSSPLECTPGVGAAEVIPNCYHMTEARKAMSPAGSTLLFTGTLSYRPNVFGLLFFVRSVLPLLPEHVRVVAVGRKPRLAGHVEAMAEVAANPRVSLNYDVPTCSPFYDGAAAAIVPLQEGTGTRLKILEAFAHRCPVVSTAKGCEGLGVTDGREILVRDDPQGFAAACMEALRNDPLRRAMTENGLAFLAEKNSQSIVERRLDEALQSAGLLPQQR